MSSNFDQIRPLTAELSALECLKNQYILCCGHSSIFVFQWIFFILAGNKNNYNISDLTSDCGVSCPLVFEKSIFCIVATLARFNFDRIFFILGRNKDNHNILDELSLSQIGPWTAELAALECLKNQFLVLWPLHYFNIDQIFKNINKKKKKKKKNKKKKKKPLCPVTVIVDSQVSNRCPWATCF